MQKKLIQLRTYNNVSQEKLARFLNISSKAYGQKERGETQFKGDEMFTISRFFNKPLEQIFLPSNFGRSEIEEGGLNEKHKGS